MVNLLAHFEGSELVDFINFVNLLVHKLQVRFPCTLSFIPRIDRQRQQGLFSVLDELIGPLNAHVMNLIFQPVTGTDDIFTHSESKRAYLTLLNNIVTSKLAGIFLSNRKSRSCSLPRSLDNSR
jgi:exportin-T